MSILHKARFPIFNTSLVVLAGIKPAIAVIGADRHILHSIRCINSLISNKFWLTLIKAFLVYQVMQARLLRKFKQLDHEGSAKYAQSALSRGKE